jgi:hypothetical protein
VAPDRRSSYPIFVDDFAPYVRRSKSLEVLIPILYLKGISTGDFEQALITCSARMPAALCLDHHADVATTDADAALTHLEQVQ